VQSFKSISKHLKLYNPKDDNLVLVFLHYNYKHYDKIATEGELSILRLLRSTQTTSIHSAVLQLCQNFKEGGAEGREEEVERADQIITGWQNQRNRSQ